jgi:hypothetical protein
MACRPLPEQVPDDTAQAQQGDDDQGGLARLLLPGHLCRRLDAVYRVVHHVHRPQPHPERRLVGRQHPRHEGLHVGPHRRLQRLITHHPVASMSRQHSLGLLPSLRILPGNELPVQFATPGSGLHRDRGGVVLGKLLVEDPDDGNGGVGEAGVRQRAVVAAPVAEVLDGVREALHEAAVGVLVHAEHGVVQLLQRSAAGDGETRPSFMACLLHLAFLLGHGQARGRYL